MQHCPPDASPVSLRTIVCLMKPPLATLLLALMLTETIPAAAPDSKTPPVAPVREVVDDYHGTKIADPYRYMENLKDPEVLGWMKSQSAYATELLDRIPARKALLERIKELDKGAPYTVSDLIRLKDGTLFYQKLNADAEMRIVCRRKSATDEEKVILDPESYEGADGSHAHLEFVSPSPDGKLMVVGISKGGSEVTTIFVRDVEAGKDLPASIDRVETAYNSPQWLPDGTGFLYCRRQKLADGAPVTDTYKNTVCYLHRMGETAEKDTPVFGVDLNPEIRFAPMDFPSVAIFPTEDFVIGQIHHGDSQEVTLYAARVDALGKKTIPWVRVCAAYGWGDELSCPRRPGVPGHVEGCAAL
jgi:prolyl oligopeptidase